MPLVLRLRKFAKACKVGRWGALARDAVDALERQARWVAAKRAAVAYAPKVSQ